MALLNVTLNEYPRCCGMYILHTFEKNPSKEEVEKTYQDGCKCSSCQADKKESLKAAEDMDKYKDRIGKSLDEYIKNYTKSKAYFLATLNGVEEGLCGKILLEKGFKVLIPMTKNPTGTEIITYIYDLSVAKEAPEKAKGLAVKRRVS